jgi:hypothetical protein
VASSAYILAMPDPALIASTSLAAVSAAAAWRSSFTVREAATRSNLAFVWPVVRVGYEKDRAVVFGMMLASIGRPDTRGASMAHPCIAYTVVPGNEACDPLYPVWTAARVRIHSR